MYPLEGRALSKAIERFDNRVKTFMADGLTFDEAYELADKLFVRDHHETMDDRRLCYECNNYNSIRKTCPKYTDNFGKPQTPLKFTLQRCKDFILKGKK
jgi:hypothetical protein